MNYLTSTPNQQAKIRAWIKTNEPVLYELATDIRRLFDGKLEGINRKEYWTIVRDNL